MVSARKILGRTISWITLAAVILLVLFSIFALVIIFFPFSD